MAQTETERLAGYVSRLPGCPSQPRGDDEATLAEIRERGAAPYTLSYPYAARSREASETRAQYEARMAYEAREAREARILAAQPHYQIHPTSGS